MSNVKHCLSVELTCGHTVRRRIRGFYPDCPVRCRYDGWVSVVTFRKILLWKPRQTASAPVPFNVTGSKAEPTLF